MLYTTMYNPFDSLGVTEHEYGTITHLEWSSHDNPILAIGTNKGCIMLYKIFHLEHSVGPRLSGH